MPSQPEPRLPAPPKVRAFQPALRPSCFGAAGEASSQWLLRHPRFTFHFTPTSSSWLNLVERWFAELTNRMLRRSAHRCVKELTDDLNAWIAAWNDNPRPFVWHKTADQILDGLNKYLTNL